MAENLGKNHGDREYMINYSELSEDTISLPYLTLLWYGTCIARKPEFNVKMLLRVIHGFGHH